LLFAIFVGITAIPAIFQRYDECRARCRDARVQHVYVIDLDLEVDAAAEWILERSSAEPPSGARSFFQHQFGAFASDTGELLFRPLEGEREAEHVDIEGKRALEVRNVQFRDETGHAMLVRQAASDGGIASTA
jgi:hypothetical protein